MARLIQDPITSDDIARYLQTQDDFALELRVRKLAHKFGFEANHGCSYDDPVTDKPRQFDLQIVKENGPMRTALAIECKSLQTNFPLVVSRIPRTVAESYHDLMEVDRSPASTYVDLPTHSPYQPRRVLCGKFYQAGSMVGKSTVQLGKVISQQGRSAQVEWSTKDGEAYEKWSQALNSAADLMRQCKNFPNGLYTAVIPILVVSDETLWVVDYNETREIASTPVQAKETTLFVGREFQVGRGLMSISHLHICTETGVQALLEQTVSGGNSWARLFSLT